MTMLHRRMLLATGMSLLAGPLRAQGRESTPTGFQGKVFTNEAGGIRLHTYMASPSGAMVTSHIVETGAGLVVIDGQFTPAAARELKRYIDSLGRPVVRLIVSHQHPDHWFGIHHLDRMAVHAGPVTAAFLRDNAAALVVQRKADSSAPEVAAVLTAGEETIGGVTFRFRPVLDTEAPEIMVVELPAANAAIVQDIVYNRVHAVVSRQIDNWIAVLRDMARSPALILAGHGEPTAPESLIGLIRYLDAVKPLIAANRGKDPAPLVEEMAKAFPDYRLPSMLALGLSRILPD